ncbi:hypothetical protein ALC60_11593 [Trachymyrmex zeteki]|uniref:Gustatory receptor n=1 Tax=Mycetomoellerius zeteki TaxID=64791 RepID=A0A151WN87_9HYME|nr:hypothetical protein ALC60_11593 [Trachymyrmex zeteki]
MTKTLQAALAPLMIVGSFCSLGLFEYPLGHTWSYFFCLYVLAIWSFLTYSGYYPVYSEIWRTLHPAVISMQITILITAITSKLVSFFYSKELKMCLHELSLMNDILEAIGATKEYQRLRKWIIRITILWIVYIFQNFVMFMFTIWVFDYDLDFDILFESFVTNYPNFVHVISALT